MYTAEEIIAILAEDLYLDPSTLTSEDELRIRDGLEDGAALAALGITDEDQVEEAHALMADARARVDDAA